MIPLFISFMKVRKGDLMITNNFFSAIADLRRNWGWFLFLGIILVLLGTAAVALSYTTTLVSIFFLGSILVASGIAELIYSFWAKEWTGFFVALLTGLLTLVVGALFLFKPIQVAAGLTLIIGLFFLVSGIFKILVSILVRFEHWGWVLFSGLVSAILGFLILSDWPEASLWVIGLFVGIDLIVYGWTWIILALSARNLELPKN